MVKASYDVPAVRHAIRLLEVLSEANCAMGVSEISKKLDLNKNMVFRLINTLTEEGWICQEDDGPKYSMSLAAFHLSAKSVSRLSISEAAYEPLKKLQQETGESVFNAVFYKDSALYIQHFDSVRTVRIAGMIGGRYPVHCTAPGKVLLAYAGDRVFDRICGKGLEGFTENTLTDRLKLRKHLDAIKSQGYAVDQEEYGKGIFCLAVPIFDYSGLAVSAIGVSVLTIYYDIEVLLRKFGPRLKTIGEEVSKKMGFRIG
jgi:DNA-binding IclR family transcriptional regulator